MPNYIFVYHGGNTPTSPEEGQKAMAQWESWFGGMGKAVVDGGNPVGKSRTVSSKGVVADGGPNPVSGYSVVSARDYDEACKMAKGCPMVKDGSGSVEVAEIIEM